MQSYNLNSLMEMMCNAGQNGWRYLVTTIILYQAFKFHRDQPLPLVLLDSLKRIISQEPDMMSINSFPSKSLVCVYARNLSKRIKPVEISAIFNYCINIIRIVNAPPSFVSIKSHKLPVCCRIY